MVLDQEFDVPLIEHDESQRGIRKTGRIRGAKLCGCSLSLADAEARSFMSFGVEEGGDRKRGLSGLHVQCYPTSLSGWDMIINF
jgi:hypothetical protein